MTEIMGPQFLQASLLAKVSPESPVPVSVQSSSIEITKYWTDSQLFAFQLR